MSTSPETPKPANTSSRPDPDQWGYNPGYFGGRLTVNSLESQINRRSRRRRRRSSRNESRGDGESRIGRKVWIVVSILALIYVGVMAFMFGWARFTKREGATQASKIAASTVARSGQATSGPVDAGGLAAVIESVRKSNQIAEEANRLVMAGDAVAAEARFREAIALSPDSLAVLLRFADVLKQNIKWNEVRDVLKRVISIDPSNSGARLALAEACYALNENDDAVAMAKWTLEDQPYAERAHQIIAEVAEGRGDYAKAIAHWQRIVNLNNMNHVAENNLGIAYMKIGKITDALKSFQNVIRDEPGNSQAYYYTILCYVENGDTEKALAVLRNSISQFGVAFVQTWIQSDEFDGLRDIPAFRGLFQSSTPAGPASDEAAPSAM